MKSIVPDLISKLRQHRQTKLRTPLRKVKMLDLDELTEEITDSLMKSIERKIVEINENQLNHYFEKGKDGVYRQRYERFEFVKNRATELPISGIIYPQSYALDKANVKFNTDLELQTDSNKQIKAGFYNGSEEHSSFDLDVTVKSTRASIGLLAIHQHGTKEIRNTLDHIPQEVIIENVKDDDKESSD